MCALRRASLAAVALCLALVGGMARADTTAYEPPLDFESGGYNCATGDPIDDALEASCSISLEGVPQSGALSLDASIRSADDGTLPSYGGADGAVGVGVRHHLAQPVEGLVIRAVVDIEEVWVAHSGLLMNLPLQPLGFGLARVDAWIIATHSACPLCDGEGVRTLVSTREPHPRRIVDSQIVVEASVVSGSSDPIPAGDLEIVIELYFRLLLDGPRSRDIGEVEAHGRTVVSRIEVGTSG
jgi:hypothetical protein